MSNVNLHTCERAAPGWQKSGECTQCQLEDNFAKWGGNFGNRQALNIEGRNVCTLSDDLLLDNFHWSKTSDKDYDLFRVELVRRLQANR